MQSLGEAARAVLLTADPHDKRRAARALARAWRRGALAQRCDVAMPDQPAWPAEPALLPPNQMPRRRKGGSERGRIAMLHALAHIEFVAIDLAVDLLGRFGDRFPRSFVDDWIAVAADEAMHFALLDRRLRTLGSHYGALPAHAGLWEAAAATADDPLARLAIGRCAVGPLGATCALRATTRAGPAELARGGIVGHCVLHRLLGRQRQAARLDHEILGGTAQARRERRDVAMCKRKFRTGHGCLEVRKRRSGAGRRRS